VILASAAAYLVGASRIIESDRTVGAAPHDGAIVRILTVVFPSAFRTDLVTSSLRQGDVTTAGARVRAIRNGREDVLLRGVGLEPSCPGLDQLLISEGRVVIRTTHNRLLTRLAFCSRSRESHREIISSEATVIRWHGEVVRPPCHRPLLPRWVCVLSARTQAAWVFVVTGGGVRFRV